MSPSHYFFFIWCDNQVLLWDEQACLMVHGGVWKPSRQSLFLFVGYWSFRIVVGLLLWILSAVWWCARCAETSRWFLALSSSCNCCYLLVVCFFLSDPGPIIVYACQALTDSLTDWRPFGTDVTTLLKMEWIDPCWWNQISKQCWNWNVVEVELATAYNSWQSWQQL